MQAYTLEENKEHSPVYLHIEQDWIDELKPVCIRQELVGPAFHFIHNSSNEKVKCAAQSLVKMRGTPSYLTRNETNWKPIRVHKASFFSLIIHTRYINSARLFFFQGWRPEYFWNSIRATRHYLKRSTVGITYDKKIICKANTADPQVFTLRMIRELTKRENMILNNSGEELHYHDKKVQREGSPCLGPFATGKYPSRHRLTCRLSRGCDTGADPLH